MPKQKLNEAQKKYLAEHLDEMWENFVDPGLKGSTCSCCEGRRKFFAAVEALGGSTEVETDVEVTEHGSIYLFHLKTQAARDFVEEKVSEPMYHGDALAVEHRYVEELHDGMADAGLKIVLA